MIVGDQHPGHGRIPGAVAHWVARGCALLLAALVMTLSTGQASAKKDDPLVLTGPAGIEVLSQYFEYTTDPAWQMTANDFVDAAAVEMLPLPGLIPDFGYSPAKIWLRLDVRNGTSTAADWLFFVHANFTQQIAIYQLAPDGTITTLLDLTEDSPFSARPVANPQMAAPFVLAPGAAATLLVAYYSQGSSRISMSVETPASFAADTQVSQAKSYVFYGMMLVMFALALLALAVLRQPVFAAYAAYVLSVLLYVAHADGTAFQYIWPNWPRFNSMASVVGGSAALVFGGIFAITFLQTRRYHPIMHRVLVGLIVSILVLDAVLWFADPQLLKRLLVVLISVSTLTFVTAGIIAARTRFREVRFYLLAWTAGIIPAVMFTARFAAGLETELITPYDGIRLALAVDALMMGLAVFDRYNHLRQMAMEETLAHAERNLALSQRLASLEESYEQVTANARLREESVKDTVHDLRQPMHALRLSLRQMLGNKGGEPNDAAQVESALGYMERLVAERLAETATATAIDVHAEAVEGGEGAAEPGIHAVLRGVADMFAAEAGEKGLGLKLVLAAPDAEVAAYPLMRVVANLVSNAIKYTREGRVLIGLRRSGAGYRVDVHDTGPGLNGTAFEAALVRNARLERDRLAAEGSGLGLTVASEIAAENGWSISSCERRRTGASIRVELPAGAAAESARRGLRTVEIEGA